MQTAKEPWAFQSDLLDIINQIEEDISLIEKQDDNNSTIGVCVLLVGSIIDIIRSIYLLPNVADAIARKTLLRSLTEYLVDLELISLENDDSLNIMFNHYFLLIGHWQHTDKDDPLPTSDDSITEEYRSYIKSQIDILLPDRIKKTRIMSVPKSRKSLVMEIDSLLESDPVLYSGFICTGLRLTKEMQISGTGDKALIDKEIRKRYMKHWSGLSLAGRYEKISKYADVNRSFKDQFFYRSFKFLSSFSHPTGFGTQANEVYNSPNDKIGVMAKSDIIITEFDLLAAFETAIYALSRYVADASIPNIWERTQKLIGYSDKIRNQRLILSYNYKNLNQK